MAEDQFGIVGTVIASAYHVEHVVAEGGFGIVYRARHGGFRAPVALKCLKVPQRLGPEQRRAFVEQFRAEGEVMFRLSASIPNVVRPLHVDVMNAPSGAFVPFMVLEWLEGETLDAIVRARTSAGKPPLSPAEALELIEPVVRALDRAHHFSGPSGNESIAHCDLKPENVFIAKAGGERIAKILDFGIAKVRGAASRVAHQGAAAGALFTPAYGAPEQWNSKAFGETGPWTDVWGLGLTLAETLVGRPVIAGDHVSLMRQALDVQRRPTPGAHGVRVGDALEAVLRRALAVEPRERYPDAGALLRALQAALRDGAAASRIDSPEIPDLVPLPRKPSGAQRLDLPLPLPPRSPSGSHALDLSAGGAFDFDDPSSGESSGLALDLAPEELLHKGSLAPLPPSPLPAPGGEVPLSTRTIPIASPLPSFSAPPPSHPVPLASSGPPSYGNAPTPPPTPPPVPPAAPPAASPRLEARLPGAPAATANVVLASPAPPLSRKSERPLFVRLIPGLALAASSVGLTLLDRVYAAVQGEVFSIGPLRTSWLAALLLVTGLVLAGRQLMPRD